MTMIGRRKSKESLSATGRYIRSREERGLPLPPTMRRGSAAYIKSSYWQTMKQRTAENSEFVDSPRNRSYKKSGVKLLITKEDFDKWVDENWGKFESLYLAGKTPSIDRIDKSEHYSIENMDVIDLKENMAKDRRKPVIATCISTGRVLRFPSAICAERASISDDSIPNFSNKNISSAIKRNGCHMGYKWEFEQSENGF